MSDLVKLTALWKHDGKDGRSYLSGEVRIPIRGRKSGRARIKLSDRSRILHHRLIRTISPFEGWEC